MQSHPMWVRGLKQPYNVEKAHEGEVAPYVGAWIETVLQAAENFSCPVAPYVGAWIETAASSPTR